MFEKQPSHFAPNLDRRLLLETYNYQKFIQLLPSTWTVGTQRCVYLGHIGRFIFGVEEETRYTALIRIQQHYPKPEPWLSRHVMWVRIYHDARLAEVVGFGGYDLTEAHTLPDPTHAFLEQEKLDELLRDWLELGLRF
jgi:uncharacterized protein YqiB (DUF1249 family)